MPFMVSSWNINSFRTRFNHIQQYLQYYKPEYLLLQELKGELKNLPYQDIEKLGYHFYAVAQKAYNGVAIISQTPLKIEHDKLEGNDDDHQARFIQAYDAKHNLHLINIYLPNGNPTFNDKGEHSKKFNYKVQWMHRLSQHIHRLMEDKKNFILAGDFNIAPYDLDAYNPKTWKDDALLQPLSRASFFKLLHMGLTDILPLFTQQPSYTWWDYRNGSFKKDQGLRIDHILASPQIAQRILNAMVDKDMRSLEKPSDHAPVCAIIQP